MSSAPRWAALAAATLALGLVVGALGLPAPGLFAALLVGLAAALRGPRVALPRAGMLAAQAVVGAALGLLLRADTLRAVGAHWAPVLGVSLLTLALTVVAGVVLARVAPVDAPTAALGMIAGGASGIVAMSGELGADDRLVALMQYLRVLVIVLLTPLLVPLAFPGEHATTAGGGGSGDVLAGVGVTVLAAVVGAALARAVHLPAGSLLGPLLVAGALALAGPADGLVVPGALQEIAFAVIGLQVGLRFTPEAVRTAGRLLLPTLAAIAAILLACAGLGALLAPLAGVSFLDGYLATTPGGLYAVLATAVSAGADSTFVLAVQVLRLFVMLLAAPPIVRALLRLSPARSRP